MIRALLKTMFRRFGAEHGFDTSYMAEMADADTSGALKFALTTSFASHSFGLPPGPYFAAKFIATRAAGCGPCVMLVIDMAKKAGVDARDLAAIANPGPADQDMRLAADFAAAVVGNTPELAGLVNEVRQRFGERGQIGLAAAIATGQLYPMLKRGLGKTLSCEILPAEFRAVYA